MKRTVIPAILIVLICMLAAGVLVYADDPDFDGEGFPWPVGDTEVSPPEPPTEESFVASATQVNFDLWTEESYPPVPGFPVAKYYPYSGNMGRVNFSNGQPILYYSDFPALWTAFTINIWSLGSDYHPYYDDDYIGIGVGFQSGDTSNATADYLLVDWKQRTQWFDFGDPSCTPGSTANVGLAVSRVFGVPTADELWGHTNFPSDCSDLNNGVEELARGSTLGNVGWWTGWIHYRLEYTPTGLKVKVLLNGQLQPQIDLTGTFGQGRWALYNFSQANSYYLLGYVESLLVPAAIDIKPGSYPNAINSDGHGVIPVAILGSEDFDVTWVDRSTLCFGGLELNVRGNGAPQCSVADVSGPEGVPDGWDDLVCHFVDNPDNWVPGDGIATLTGMLLPAYGGVSFEASDEITIVP